MEATDSTKPLNKPKDQLDEGSINSTIADSVLDGSTAPSPVITSKSVTGAIDDRYDTNHRKRGIALIINQVNFSGTAKREGNDMDRNRISSVLIEIGFDVRVVNDPKKVELLDMLKAIADEDHSDNDCLVVVAMTHGEKDILFAFDENYPLRRLCEPFVGNACPSLLGKPKLFFIHTCRSQRMNFGARVKRMLIEQRDSAESSVVPLNYVIPTMPDLLVMYSTYDENDAWRNTVNGSCFIQSLSIELELHAHSQEFLHILTAVSRRMAHQYESDVFRKKKLHVNKQQPCVVSMLTKLLYF